MNRWQALVEIVRLLVESDKPHLAFASVCVFSVPIIIVSVGLFYMSQNSAEGMDNLIPDGTAVVEMIR